MARLVALLACLAMLLLAVPAPASAESWLVGSWRWYVNGPSHSWEIAADHHADGITLVNAFGPGHQLHLRMHDWACVSVEQDFISPMVVVRATHAASRPGPCDQARLTGGRYVEHVHATNAGFVGYAYEGACESARDCDKVVTAGPSGQIAYGPWAPLVDQTTTFRLL